MWIGPAVDTRLVRSVIVLLTNRGSRESPSIRQELIDIELALPLERDEDPWLRRMEIKVSRTEAKAIAGLHRGLIRQHTIFEPEHFD